MNKTLLLASFLSCASLASFAQAPSLTSANISPALNDSFVSVVCKTQGVTQGASGASVSWDFSTLVDTNIADSVNIGSVIYASAASSYSLLTTAASFIPTTTFATSNYAVIDPGASITTYYAESVSKLSTTAIYYDASDNALYTNPMDALQFPFTYSTTFNDTYAGYIRTAALGTTPVTESGTVTVTGDAWGQLKLPPAPPSSTVRIYSGVLRVHSYQVFTDSADIFGSPLVPDTLDTYTWYQPGYHSPLLTIATLNSPVLHEKSVSYARKQIANHENVPGLTLDASLQVYPNPAVNHINILFNTDVNDQVHITLVDVLGREVAVISDAHGPQNISYNVSSLAKGLYMLRLRSATGTVTRTIEIR